MVGKKSLRDEYPRYLVTYVTFCLSEAMTSAQQHKCTAAVLVCQATPEKGLAGFSLVFDSCVCNWAAEAAHFSVYS